MKGNRRWILAIASLVAVALGARLLFSNDVRVGLIADAASYAGLANNLATHGYYGQGTAPDASRPPLFSVILALVLKLFHAPFDYWTFALLNVAFDALSVALLVIIGRRVTGSLSTWGIFLLAISPIWFAHDNVPITEPLSILLFLAFLERWTREKRTARDELWAGLFLGGETLVRGVFIYFPIGLLIWELLMRKAPKGARIQGYRRRAIFLAGGYLPPVIWGIRNLVTLGQFTMSQDSWTAILMAWCAIKLPLMEWRFQEHSQYLTTHPYAAAILGHDSPEQHKVFEAAMKQEVIDFIKHDTWQWIWNIFPKTLRLWVTGWWNPYPYVFSPRYLSNNYIWVWCLPVLLLGSLGLAAQWLISLGRLKPPTDPLENQGNPISQWRATRTQLCVICYITATLIPFTVDSRYSIIAYVLFSLWIGPGLLRLVR